MQVCIQIVAILETVCILVFAEVLCMFRKVCSSSEDIDIEPLTSNVLLPCFGVHFIGSVAVHQLSQYIHFRSELCCATCWSFVISVVEIVFGVLGLLGISKVD